MSSYWAGYAGTGLILTEPEFSAMLEVYMEKNPNERETIENMEDCMVDEIGFIKSIYAGSSMPGLQDKLDEYADKVVYICELTDDNVDGLTFWPFYNPDGRMNVAVKGEDGCWGSPKYSHPIWDSKADRCYVCWSKKDMSSPRAFEEKPYESYDAFVAEFASEWAAYLPDNFDWNVHLGYMSYACYA